MKIGIDARFAVHKRRGIGNYSLMLLLNLAEIDPKNDYVLYTDVDDLEGVLPRKPNFLVKKILPGNYLVWEQLVLPLRAARDGLDILHCPGNTAPMFLHNKVKLILSIHDVMFLKSYSAVPQCYSRYQNMGRIYRKLIVPRTVRRLAKVITVSDFSKTDILLHLKSLQEKDIHVTHEAVDEKFKLFENKNLFEKLKNKHGIQNDYIFTLGATDPRKNTERIIRTFLELKSKCSISEQLVICGLPNWKTTLFYEMVQGSKYKSDIVFLDFITEDELVCFYNYAKVFLYPSLYEGFGLPPLEAMSCGVPVITSNLTSIPEIVGDAALLIDPYDDEQLQRSLLHLLSEEDVRKEYVERGLRQVRKFSWRKMASETLDIYKSLA
ncbi:glycosyltransferase family 4 protein [Geobacter argillaceus]|uniref:Glycosyltransferase involved in cell wall biosynthesis n=1 Tax=Geobacter argillaceus TaxID=345631 RepID=A0A562W803_9BACT|nr:glycosyltransferase family 1 protein [Geobacter argillaceus]TWJ26356.1 glycosyltransferase involved in cell wall biosynthesis [Geobacter argillaceus]